ncbi:MAG: hypothetical protein ACREV5_20465 [Steroidobacter sp.]
MTTKTGPETRAADETAKALFDESVERLDARTCSRLTQARHAALDELEKSRPMRARWLWAPAAGLAAAVLAVLVGSWPGSEPAAPESLLLEDFDLVAGTENLELLQDVEFYAWLAEQPPAPTDAG